jgi:hypothetical protein
VDPKKSRISKYRLIAYLIGLGLTSSMAYSFSEHYYESTLGGIRSVPLFEDLKKWWNENGSKFSFPGNKPVPIYDNTFIENHILTELKEIKTDDELKKYMDEVFKKNPFHFNINQLQHLFRKLSTKLHPDKNIKWPLFSTFNSQWGDIKKIYRAKHTANENI